MFEYDPHDVSHFKGWHVPTTEAEYERSPQRALWYEARGDKMHEYKDIPVWRLIKRKNVPAGANIYNVKWVNRIKPNEVGGFGKLNPRLCMIGTQMDRNVYATFADYMRMSSMKIVIIVTKVYGLFQFQLDDKNAFQNTPVDPAAPKIYSRQAPGFVEKDEDGIPFICEYLTCLQGGIHSANRYDKRKVQALLECVGMRMCTWDKRVFVYHVGPLADTSANLHEIIKSLQADLPDIDGKPCGFAILGTHADDGVGGADCERTAKYIQGRASTIFACELTPWRRPLGFTLTDHGDEGVSLDIPGYLNKLMDVHLGSDSRISPKHIMSKSIMDLECVAPPDSSSPEYADYKHMQGKARELIGALMWGAHAWPQLLAPANRVARLMHEPTMATYKHGKYALMHIAAFPIAPRWAPKECSSLELASPTVPPFSEGKREFGLHMLVDSNKETPKCTTGVDIMLGGAVIDTTSARQHHVSPDVHAGEVHAGCYAVAKLLPIRGLLHEIGVHQLLPTPVYFDSASTIFVVRNEMAVRRSAWLLSKLAFVHEASENKQIDGRKIGTEDNSADGKTKFIDVKKYWRHLTYTHNISPAALKQDYNVTVPLTSVCNEMICAVLAGMAP